MKRFYLLVILLSLSVLCAQGVYGMPGKKKYLASSSDTQSNRLKDRDGDGIPDDEDLCPDIPGPAKSFGCPDSDGDGVPDFKDDCPDIPGHPDYNGCPDSDGDGIPDNIDACPFEMGPIENNGCPVKKKEDAKAVIPKNSKNNSDSELTDLVTGLSVFDYNVAAKNMHYSSEPEYYIVPEVITESVYEEAKRAINRIDREKHTKRDREPAKEPVVVPPMEDNSVLKIHNKGNLDKAFIQKLESSLAKVKFEHGRVKLKNEAKQPLESLADLLLKNPKWGLLIHSYATDADNDFRNMQLSENRGITIKGIIVSKKVDESRIAYKGYGNAKGNSLTVFEILK